MLFIMEMAPGRKADQNLGCVMQHLGLRKTDKNTGVIGIEKHIHLRLCFNSVPVDP
jgi:hypothetical protein